MNYCKVCDLSIPDEFILDGECPACGGIVTVMCENDRVECGHGVVDGLAICPKCGAFMCPICGCHKVNPISRVTGYYGPVDAWNSGKRAELVDRVRYTV